MGYKEGVRCTRTIIERKDEDWVLRFLRRVINEHGDRVYFRVPRVRMEYFFFPIRMSLSMTSTWRVFPFKLKSEAAEHSASANCADQSEVRKPYRTAEQRAIDIQYRY